MPSHPWSHVVIGMWHKYPNSKCTHVVSIDTIDRSIDPVTGIIRTERVLGCKQRAPAWIVKVHLSPIFMKHTSRSNHFAAFRWFRRCFCTGNLICRSCDTKCNHFLCQSLSFPIRYLLRTNTIFPNLVIPNRICTNSRDSGKNGSLAVSGERIREVVGAAF